jgi:hypothetical protein
MIPAIKDFIETGAFLKEHWASVIEFLGTGYGTLTTVGFGFVLVAIAAYRALHKQSEPFPYILGTVYQTADFDLNGVEDHLTFRFKIDNSSPYEFQFKGEKNGYGHFVAGGLNILLLRPWAISFPQTEDQVNPNGMTDLAISIILDLNLAAAFAYKDPDLSNTTEYVEFDFSRMGIMLTGTGKQSNMQTQIVFQSKILVSVPSHSLHWAKYRSQYEVLHLAN